ncbi:radical SAM family heme chaperone HemW [Cellulosilyticum ruminicola]|uniref:radical SAM family heme chaperone HemW n=1 Tax=Cellulosilyticum ruminicola TaxID=425254 RepID=UPI0006D2BEF7|nr:radical SAM family heme chaperone HemW [Cellulosilyticum ruminicola]
MEIGLYIHIPFCISKCFYCDFLSFPKEDMQEAYINALVKEIENYGKMLDSTVVIKSIFIGGGTPTVLSPFLLDKLAAAIVANFNLSPNLEWTIEANPGTITKEKVEVIAKYPINRVSMGLQTTHDYLLKKIGRRHMFKDWEESLKLIKTYTNCAVNADLMFALPGQTMEEFKSTLETVTQYDLEHISVYALIIEEGTCFGKLYEEGKMEEFSDELDREMYHFAQSYLKEKGYHQYEISNWAKPNKECQHNLIYWHRVSYIGVGLGARSLFEETRYANEENLKTYIEAAGDITKIRHEEDRLTKTMCMEEYMFLGLRLLEGISESDFEKQFGQSVWDVYKTQLDKWIKYNILVKEDDHIKLTAYGLDVCNEVFSSFLM